MYVYMKYISSKIVRATRNLFFRRTKFKLSRYYLVLTMDGQMDTTKNDLFINFLSELSLRKDFRATTMLTTY